MTDQEIYALNRRVAEALDLEIAMSDSDGRVLLMDGSLRNWAGDTDAALELATDSDLRVLVRKWHEGYSVDVRWYERGAEYGYDADGETFAVAIVRAWLAWKEASE